MPQNPHQKAEAWPIPVQSFLLPDWRAVTPLPAFPPSSRARFIRETSWDFKCLGQPSLEPAGRRDLGRRAGEEDVFSYKNRSEVLASPRDSGSRWVFSTLWPQLFTGTHPPPTQTHGHRDAHSSLHINTHTHAQTYELDPRTSTQTHEDLASQPAQIRTLKHSQTHKVIHT